VSDHLVCCAKEGFAGFSFMPQPPLLKEEENTCDRTSTPMNFIQYPSGTHCVQLHTPFSRVCTGSIMSFEYGHSMCACYLLVNGAV